MSAVLLLNKALAGRYEIEREAGAGGMATVYLARDIRHERHVALKVLNAELGAVLGAERFLAEIRVTANLQHPNILPLFDSGEANGLLFYVMPFVEGESLRHRLDRERQLPVDEAVRIAVAIAGALDYAHQHGVIHRDLKPENILLQHGQPVVADFGIALAVSKAGGQRVTQTGLSLGTPQYMSPEQATGDRIIDGRSDIYSLGALTYEMLAGEAPHTGSSAQAVIARLMTEEPRPLRVVRPSVPPHVDAAVLSALAKLPADRFATAKEFADAIEGRVAPRASMTSAAFATSRQPVARRVIPWVVAGILGVIAGGAAVQGRHASRETPARPFRFFVDPPPGMPIYTDGFSAPFALSPDGRAVVLAVGPNASLFLRRLDELAPIAVGKIEHPVDLRFSPDGNSLVYQTSGVATPFMKVAVGAADFGAAPTVVLDSVSLIGLDWAPSAGFVFARFDGLWRMPAGGSKPVRIVSRDTVVDGLWSNPSILAAGSTIAFRISPHGTRAGSAHDRLGIVAIDGGKPTVVDLEVQNVLGLDDGLLIYGSLDGRIMGSRLDLRARTTQGDPVVLLENVARGNISGPWAALSGNGTLAYLSGAANARVEVVDEHGATVGTPAAEPRDYDDIGWSPDGTRILLASSVSGRHAMWVYDLASRVGTQLAQADGGVMGQWTPDGRRIVFLSLSKGQHPYSISSDGSGVPELVTEAGPRYFAAMNVTSDGKYVLGMIFPQDSEAASRKIRIQAFPLAGEGKPETLFEASKPSHMPTVSPNGRWMSYASDESGRFEVYIRPFPRGPGRVQVSSNGGSDAQWSRDGRRLIYRGAGAFRAATLDVTGPLPRVVRTDSMFADIYRRSFSLHPDGKRIAVLRGAGEGTKLVVVLNWLDEARSKLGLHAH
jgi:hypothetical protein